MGGGMGVNMNVGAGLHGHTPSIGMMQGPLGGGAVGGVIAGGDPPLVRTSAISQSAASYGSAVHHHHVQDESHTAQASLHILSDLDAMTQNWTPEEQRAQRRLVRFSREQRGPVILARFEPFQQEHYDKLIPCISCIYWAEKQDFFVTSVDCLYLLEQLINTKFKVDEKNRIRRNLEGYHPLTVSKGGTGRKGGGANANADNRNSQTPGASSTGGTAAGTPTFLSDGGSGGTGAGAGGSGSELNSPTLGNTIHADFFKLIMSFPAPKPRNIEKDVKVFKWDSLEKALKKIVSKYSADYSRAAR